MAEKDDDKRDEHDVDGLLRKNAELLAEVKKLKQRITDLEGERDAAEAKAEEAAQTMRRVQLDEPLEQAVGGAFVAPWRVMRPLVEEHFDVSLGEDGKPSIVRKESGEAVPLDGMLRAMQEIPDLAAAIRAPSGGGARGGKGNGERLEDAPPAKRKVAPQYGLR